MLDPFKDDINFWGGIQPFKKGKGLSTFMQSTKVDLHFFFNRNFNSDL